MSEFNISQYFQYLNQRVNDGIASECGLIIKLRGTKNFDAWYRLLSKSLPSVCIELSEYFRNDGIVTSIPIEIQNNEKLRKSVIDLLDYSLISIIVSNSEPSIQMVISRYLSSGVVNRTAFKLIKFLKEKYSLMEVRNTAELFNQNKEMFNKSLEEQSDWASKVINVIKTQLFAASSAVYESKSERDIAIINTQEHLESILLMALNPESQRDCLKFLFGHEKIRIQDVISVIRESNNINNKVVKSKPIKKGGKKKNPRCQMCNQSHPVGNCPNSQINTFENTDHCAW